MPWTPYSNRWSEPLPSTAHRRQPNKDLLVTRRDDEVTLAAFVRLIERSSELRPELTKPGHRIISLDLAHAALRIDGMAP